MFLDICLLVGSCSINRLTLSLCFNSYPLEKMAAILADDIFICIFVNTNDRNPLEISLKYVPRSLIANKAALVQVIPWCRTGDKPLPGPVMSQFIDAYMRH